MNYNHCGTSIGNAKVTDLDFRDDTVIVAMMLVVLVMSLHTLLEETKPLGTAPGVWRFTG